MSAKEVLVIGGGLGGISAAISLAAEGFQVKLFEKNKHLGGKLNRKNIQGFEFDLGPSILTMPHIFEKLFTIHDKKMEDYIKIIELKKQWRAFFPDDTVLDLYADSEKMIAKNDCLNSEDLSSVQEYLKYCRELAEFVEKGYFAKGFDSIKEIIKFHGLIKPFRKLDYFSTMSDGTERYLNNPYLIDLFNFFIKYVGSSPYQAPAVLNLLPHIQFEYGLWYVPGGLYNIARGLEKLMQEVGISIYKDSEVISINIEHKQVRGITLADGSSFQGDYIVSNMEVIPAYQNLISAFNVPDKYHDKYEPACSGYVLHLGVDRKYPQLDHHNFFFSQDPRQHFKSVFEDYKLPDDPTIYLVASSRTDRQQAPVDCENLKILPHIPHLGKGDFTREEYNKLRERVLIKLEKMGLTDLRKHIVVEDEWLPEDIKKNYYSNHGSIYGVVSDRKKNKGFKAPKKSEFFDSLYFTGGSVNPGGGMPMVLLSGQQVKELICENEGGL
ncbi:MAG: phytoene desaturase family protein [Bacillota bacterium]